MDNNTTALRELTLCDFDEPMLFSQGPSAPASVLAISCHWQEGGGAYLTLYDKSVQGSADFSIKRIFRSADSECYHLLLGLLPREAGDCEKPPLFLTLVANPQRVIVLGLPDIEAILPLPALDAKERCDLGVLSAVLGPVPTWEELKRRSEA